MITNGWPSRRTLYAVRWALELALGSTLVTRAFRTHAWLDEKPNTSTPPVCSRLPFVRAARLERSSDGIPSCTLSGVDDCSAQSWPSTVTPDRQRADRTSTRLAPAEPAARAAMQNGKHGAVGMHAMPPAFRFASWPHRGISQTVASSSRHVPREMQSRVGSVVRSPLVPSDAGVVSYRVYDQRTERT